MQKSSIVDVALKSRELNSLSMMSWTMPNQGGIGTVLRRCFACHLVTFKPHWTTWMPIRTKSPRPTKASAPGPLVISMPLKSKRKLPSSRQRAQPRLSALKVLNRTTRHWTLTCAVAGKIPPAPLCQRGVLSLQIMRTNLGGSDLAMGEREERHDGEHHG